MQFSFDGNASLKDQENTLNFTENAAPLTLVSYVRGPAAPPPPAGGNASHTLISHVNVGTFEPRDQTIVLPLLQLVEVTGGQSIDDLLKKSPGKKLVFVSDVWVAGVVKKIAGIR